MPLEVVTSIVDAVSQRSDGVAHFVRQGFVTAAELLNESNTLDRHRFLQVAANSRVQIDELVAQALAFLAAPDQKKPACGDRCHYCCFQHVVISAPEAFAIADTLDVTEEVKRRVHETADRVNGISHAQRYASAIPCPLLKERRCTAYAARPQACRGYLSLSRLQCERDWGTKGLRNKEVKSRVPLLVEPQLYAEAITLGRDYAIRLAAPHLQLIRGELAAMVDIALGERALDRWLAGEWIFPADMFRPVTFDFYTTYVELLDHIGEQSGIKGIVEIIPGDQDK